MTSFLLPIRIFSASGVVGPFAPSAITYKEKNIHVIFFTFTMCKAKMKTTCRRVRSFNFTRFWTFFLQSFPCYAQGDSANIFIHPLGDCHAPINGLPQDGGVGENPRKFDFMKLYLGRDSDIHKRPDPRGRGGGGQLTFRNLKMSNSRGFAPPPPPTIPSQLNHLFKTPPRVK